MSLSRRRALLAGVLAARVSGTASAAVTSTDVCRRRWQTLEINSRTLGQIRRVQVHVPDTAVARENVTLLCVLDAERFFETAVAFAGALERIRGARLGPCVVLGINNAEHRTRDLTPSPSSARRDGTLDPGGLVRGGGAQRFAQALQTELLPCVQRWLREQGVIGIQRRILVGHSFAGLFVLQTLACRPELFDDYAAFDPSLWWDQGKWAQAWMHKGCSNAQGKRLYVAFASVARRVNVLHRQMAQRFETHGVPRLLGQGVETVCRDFENEIHGTVPYPALFDALKTWFVAFGND